MNFINFLLGLKLFVVLSGSMEPSIKTGSIVVVAKSPSYSQNDVVTFKNQNNLTVTHRIIYKSDNNSYLTGGDANKSIDDGQIEDKNIIGKVVFSVPYLGYVINSTKNPRWFILLVIVPATILIYEEIKSIASQIKSIKIEKPINKIFIIVPLVIALFVFSAISLFSSNAYFSDIERSIGNMFQASSTFR